MQRRATNKIHRTSEKRFKSLEAKDDDALPLQSAIFEKSIAPRRRVGNRGTLSLPSEAHFAPQPSRLHQSPRWSGSPGPWPVWRHSKSHHQLHPSSSHAQLTIQRPPEKNDYANKRRLLVARCRPCRNGGGPDLPISLRRISGGTSDLLGGAGARLPCYSPRLTGSFSTSLPGCSHIVINLAFHQDDSSCLEIPDHQLKRLSIE